VSVQVERALSADLWSQVRTAFDAHCEHVVPGESEEEVRQWRTARAATLLTGDSSLRRDEAAHARRENLRPSLVTAAGLATGEMKETTRTSGSPVWALSVIGKRRKQRTVPVSTATLEALWAHWADRARDFHASAGSAPLISPLVVPGADAARHKHDGGLDGQTDAPYAADALGRLVRTAVQRLAGELLQEGVLTRETHARLLSTSARAFRHTFGTRAVARQMPIDVVQTILATLHCKRRPSMCAQNRRAYLRQQRNIMRRRARRESRRASPAHRSQKLSSVIGS
jgi:integrase